MSQRFDSIVGARVFQKGMHVHDACVEFYSGLLIYHRQLGSLYWQLEDIWVAPSWAGKILLYIRRSREQADVMLRY